MTLSQFVVSRAPRKNEQFRFFRLPPLGGEGWGGGCASLVALRSAIRVGALTIVIQCGNAYSQQILAPADFTPYAAAFSEADRDPVENLIPNDRAGQWIADNVPLFDCPDEQFKRTYFFRWWTYRKHIRETPHGIVLTEFLTPVRHAGPHNTISCAFGHHLAEGRWMRDQRPLDDYIRFWFRSGRNGGPAEHFHKYSSWAAAAIYDRYLVTLDKDFVVGLLDDLVADYEFWESRRMRPDGLFWQFDVSDGMEESISGSRKAKNIRPTINSYMAANARAISQIAELADRSDLAKRFRERYDSLRSQMIESLWDGEAKFFKVRFENGQLSDAREAIGFIPWMFDLAGLEHAEAWRQLTDPAGFMAPRGLTTAERRHPGFRTHGVGTCEWDGAAWPFATSQTLAGLANVLRGPAQPYVTRRNYFDALRTYAMSHQKDGIPYIGEYHDETTGEWLITGPKEVRSRHYNHSTFCDLVISGLVGIVPSDDDRLEVDPLVPADVWDWFCLDRVRYHGHDLTIVWDRTGDRYKKGAGFTLWADGKVIAQAADLGRLTGMLTMKNGN
jgi:hypothetical protein